MKKIALIDIGTNSVRMIILNENDRNCIYAKKYVDTTRIGEGVDKTKKISIEGISRTIIALEKYYKICKNNNIDDIYAIATSAVRDAENKDVLLDLVKEMFDIKISIISGEEEARLGFLGVRKGLEDSGFVKKDEYILVIDIGGGSTELIVGKNDDIEYSVSIDIGAVRMSDKFIDSDPINLINQNDMADFIRVQIKKILLTIKKYPIKTIIGIGGTISTAGSITLKMEEYDRTKIHNSFISLEKISKMNRILLNQTIEDRKNTVGLQPSRADIIPAGFMILQMLLLNFEKDGIIISEYDNLEGMFFDIK